MALSSTVLVSEWLTNPIGADAAGEWVELVNKGDTAVSLVGWTLAADAGKPYRFSAVVLEPGEYRVFPRQTTKLSLRNDSGALALMDATGEPVDAVRFIGTAPEGKSANRGAQGLARFAMPTPGNPNDEPALAAIVHAPPPPLTATGAGEGIAGAAVAGFVVAVASAVALVALFKKNHDLAERFFS
jgi:hypothetical protein